MPTLTTILLLLSSSLLGVLFIYALIIFVSSLFASLRKDGAASESATLSHLPDVEILIPSHHEGPGLLRLIETLLEQDYDGKISIVALFENENDSSLPLLQSAFEFPLAQKKERILVYNEQNRALSLSFIGKQSKFQKLNAALQQGGTPLVGFMDADHRATKGWVRTSAQRLESDELDAVQSCRMPLSLRTLPQIWDSAQNHIGNEFFNRVLSYFGQSTFFTGTSCLFKRKALAEGSFSECVTEDTFLSYDLLLSGAKIAHEPAEGSREEVAPDLRSYLSRRRRWANGHNHVFFHHLGRILKSKLPAADKCKLAFHGAFYLVPICVILFVQTRALYLTFQLTTQLQLLCAALGLLFAVSIKLLVLRSFYAFTRDVITIWFWLTPLLVLLTPWLLAFTDDALYYYLLQFPYQRETMLFEAFCVLSPLLSLLLATRKYSFLGIPNTLKLCLSYPFLLFFDILAALLGFVDFLVGKSNWGRVQRTFEEDPMLAAGASASKRALSRIFAPAFIIVCSLVLLNDFSAVDNCGEPVAPFFEPVIFTSSGAIRWNVDLQKDASESNELRVTTTHKISSESEKEIQISHFIDGELIEKRTHQGASLQSSYHYLTKASWRPLTYKSTLRSEGVFCEREIKSTTVLRELKNDGLFINHEPFLIKAVIPSFSSAGTNLPLEKGYQQIKALGANGIRIYHAPYAQIRELATKYNLLLIDQPDKSTWENIDITSRWDRNLLEERLGELYAEQANFPYTLFHLAGNELEIAGRSRAIKPVFEFLETLHSRNVFELLSYSTYYTFLKLSGQRFGHKHARFRRDVLG